MLPKVIGKCHLRWHERQAMLCRGPCLMLMLKRSDVSVFSFFLWFWSSRRNPTASFVSLSPFLQMRFQQLTITTTSCWPLISSNDFLHSTTASRSPLEADRTFSLCQWDFSYTSYQKHCYNSSITLDAGRSININTDNTILRKSSKLS